MNIHCENILLSSGINDYRGAIDWHDDYNLIAFASSNTFMIIKPPSQVLYVNHDVHKEKVTGLRFVKCVILNQLWITTCSADSTVGLWSLQLLEDASESFCVDIKKKAVFSDSFDCCQVYSLPKRQLVLEVKFIDVCNSSLPLLLLGNDTGKITILTATKLGKYIPVLVLEGDCDYYIASGSKDSTVRLWSLKLCRDGSNDTMENTICLQKYKIPLSCESGSFDLMCSLEAVLHGHEGSVSSVCWATDGNIPYLLTCSMTLDRAIIIWSLCESNDTCDSNGLWLEVARLGEVGGNREGYFGAKFNANASQVVANSYQGGMFLWTKVNNVWQQTATASGHFDEVVDLTWEPLGRYLLTTSKDKTTRLFAPCKIADNKTQWYEIARPQVHGYDMTCIAALGDHKFVSGAEEKVIRTFTATSRFLENLEILCGFHYEMGNDKLAGCATVPSLGLSNKAVLLSEVCNEEDLDHSYSDKEVDFIPLNFTGVPTESQLILHTLWPEVGKLYGHGNEILALCSTSDGKILASSCRATNEIDAKVIIWDAENFRMMYTLQHHRLSVVCMVFSPNDQYLLTASRDRTWCVYERCFNDGDKKPIYKFMGCSTKDTTQHSRIIWSCDWFPDSQRFITASRDKTLGIWSINDKGFWAREASFAEKDEVTAVAVYSFTHVVPEGCFLFASGLNNGKINLQVYNSLEKSFSCRTSSCCAHHKTVRRLKFRPKFDSDSSVALASCSSDNSIFLHKILLSV